MLGWPIHNKHLEKTQNANIEHKYVKCIYHSYLKIHESLELTTSTHYNNENQLLMEMSRLKSHMERLEMDEEHMNTWGLFLPLIQQYKTCN